ncbi:IPT/TIG domain-containing protein [Aquimarina mytili]|uniref:IPT/TIG domain-containing protein n=1 Tax=Aquimarina mytili TaxID=874423 RepID=A0A936ZZ55_9FLAO|nr:IPT/TIG domain-containing protein [Aquimarina mytili]MBL0684570.1 IPT/TIG domain-containing protein [Aquimarina mytili]
MKNIYLIALLSVLIYSCSSDDSAPNIETLTQLPTIESVSTTTATAGDIITITGKNFDPNKTYVVKFNEVEGTVTELAPTFLKAQVPDEATSGDITLTVDGQTTVVGSIEINTTDIFVFHSSAKKLAKIDVTTANFTYIGENIDYGTNTRGAVIHSTNNEYIGFENDFTQPYIVRINLETGTTTNVSIPTSFLTVGTDFDDTAVDKDDNVYIFHNSAKKLAKIDVVTGNLTYLGENIDYGANTRGAIIHKQNNEYIGFENDFTQPYLVRINLENGNVTNVSIPTSFLADGIDFSDITVDENDNIYIFHDSVKKLAKIDVVTGNLTYIGENIDYGRNSLGAVIHAQNNEYFGFEDNFGEPYTARINLDTGAVINTPIPNSFLTVGKDFDDIAIKR